MPAVNNEEMLRKWFRGCPALSDDNSFRVDYMSEDPTEYAIFAVPSTINHHENVLGEMVPDDIQTINFIFASKQVFGADEMQNMENYGFYQDVVTWIIQQNAARNMPRINEGHVISVVPTLSQYPSDMGAESAKYQIQIQMKYRYCQ